MSSKHTPHQEHVIVSGALTDKGRKNFDNVFGERKLPNVVQAEAHALDDFIRREKKHVGDNHAYWEQSLRTLLENRDPKTGKGFVVTVLPNKAGGDIIGWRIAYLVSGCDLTIAWRDEYVEVTELCAKLGWEFTVVSD